MTERATPVSRWRDERGVTRLLRRPRAVEVSPRWREPDCRPARFRSRHLRGRASAGVRRTGDRGVPMDTPSPVPGREPRGEPRQGPSRARARTRVSSAPEEPCCRPGIINSSRPDRLGPAPRSPLAETPSSPSRAPAVLGQDDQDGARGRRHRRRVPRRAPPRARPPGCCRQRRHGRRRRHRRVLPPQDGGRQGKLRRGTRAARDRRDRRGGPRRRRRGGVLVLVLVLVLGDRSRRRPRRR